MRTEAVKVKYDKKTLLKPPHMIQYQQFAHMTNNNQCHFKWTTAKKKSAGSHFDLRAKAKQCYFSITDIPL